MLVRTLRRMRNKSAAGLDSWRVDELKRLPLALMDRLATMFNLIEETGRWPQSMTQGIIT